jgi:hypothetical protein
MNHLDVPRPQDGVRAEGNRVWLMDCFGMDHIKVRDVFVHTVNEGFLTELLKEETTPMTTIAGVIWMVITASVVWSS